MFVIVLINYVSTYSMNFDNNYTIKFNYLTYNDKQVVANSNIIIFSLLYTITLYLVIL